MTKSFEVACVQVAPEQELTRIVDVGDGKSVTLTGWSALLWEIQQLHKKIEERRSNESGN